MNQTRNIKKAMMNLLDCGITDKSEIYTEIVEDLQVPRPTVRRVAHDLKKELIAKVRVLESGDKEQIFPIRMPIH